MKWKIPMLVKGMNEEKEKKKRKKKNTAR